MIYFLSFIFLLIALLLYFRIAYRFKIIDCPNARSSHKHLTIRGAGVIFLVAFLIAGALHYQKYYIPVFGALTIGLISFIDDQITLSHKLRLLVQLFAVTLLFYFLHIFRMCPLWMTISLFILVIGTINAYNFMDGINGMTGLYSLVVLGALQYVNMEIQHFINPDMIWYPGMACVIFLYFNFRKRARCFAGDVGSISMAFWVMFLLLKLIVVSGHWTYFLFLSIYGVENVLTISHRIIRKENIFKPHRIHLFQLISNELGWSQLVVTTIYAGLQVLTIVLILWLRPLISPYLLTALVLIPPGVIYLLLKPRLMRLVEETDKEATDEQNPIIA